MIAAHFENLLFLLLIVVALLFQLLARAAGKAKSDKTERTSPSSTPEMSRPKRPVPRESDEERVRKFLEALGQPPTSSPPPPVMPRADIPLRPLAPVQPPIAQIPLWKAAREHRRKPDLTPKQTSSPPSASRAERIFPPAITHATAFEVHEEPLPVEQLAVTKRPVEAYAAAMRPVVKGADLKIDIATLLASKAGLREAIILREIFGSPRSLQPLDLVENP